jgi:hypothetical protein
MIALYPLYSPSWNLSREQRPWKAARDSLSQSLKSIGATIVSRSGGPRHDLRPVLRGTKSKAQPDSLGGGRLAGFCNSPGKKLSQHRKGVVSELSENCQQHVKSLAGHEVWHRATSPYRRCRDVRHCGAPSRMIVVGVWRWHVVQAVLVLVGRREIGILQDPNLPEIPVGIRYRHRSRQLI